MDFALTDEQQAVVDLAAQILGDRCTPEKLKEVEAGADWFHRELWADLAKAELIGLCLPEADGGGGYGFLEACLLLQEAGRAVAPIPLASALVAAATLAEFGSDAQRGAWLPGVITGEKILVTAVPELDATERAPALAAVIDGDTVTLDGIKTTVVGAHVADGLLVTARSGDEPVLVLVPTDAAGLTLERQDSFNHEPTSYLTFSGVRLAAADAVVARGAEALDWMIDRLTVALCAVASGVGDQGMRITAEYVTGRKQFDRPIGSFQAVGHRMADCFIDAEAIRLSMLMAASRLADGARDDEAVAIAKYWASYSGSRIGHAGLHLHGGISIDLDYPIHRYFLTAKHLELQLGASGPQLARLGTLIAAE